MLTSLIGALIEVVRKNHSRKVPRIRVFEVGRVYLRDASAQDGPLSVAGVRQPVRIGAAAYGSALEEQWGEAVRKVDFFDAKADLEALVSPLAVRLEAAEHPAFHPSRSARVLVDARVPAQALLDAMAAEKPPIVERVSVFDLYQGPSLPAGKKSLAFRVVMQHTERTLTDAEADAARDALVALLGRKFSAILRN